MVQSIVRKSQESKYRDEGFVFNVAQEGTVAGTSGHAIRYPAMPGAGTASSNRIGNKIAVTGIVIRYTLLSETLGQINTGISGRMYLVAHRDGGNFNPEDFLVSDFASPAAQFTSRSLRNLEKMSDFKVLAEQAWAHEADTYQTNSGLAKDMTVGWRGNLPISFQTGGTTPLQNQIAIIFVANSGSLVPTANGINVRANCRVYYKDA